MLNAERRCVVRPERFELPASWFVARRSIQLSYGRARGAHIITSISGRHSEDGIASVILALSPRIMAEREGFEPSMGF